MPLFLLFNLVFYCLFSFFDLIFYRLLFSLFFHSCFVPVFFPHVVSSLIYSNLLENTLLVVVDVVVREPPFASKTILVFFCLLSPYGHLVDTS
jgi:hypothetical protein